MRLTARINLYLVKYIKEPPDNLTYLAIKLGECFALWGEHERKIQPA